MAVLHDEDGARWKVQCHYRDAGGNARRTTKRGFDRRLDAEAWEDSFMRRVKGKAHTMTLAAFVGVYEDDVRPGLRESTWQTKEHMLRSKVLPYLSEMRICDISDADVIRWHNELRKLTTSAGKPISGTDLRSIDSQLSAVLNHAVRHYGLKRNPVADVGRVGRKEAGEMLFWTREEYLSFADAVADKPVSHLAFEILYWCGLREGEMLALTAGDVDFGRGSIAVTKSLAKTADGWAAVPPKTSKSRRSVSVPQFLLDEISDHVAANGIEPGMRLVPCTKHFLRHEMDRGTRAAGVKRIRVHDLRHSHVSLLLDLGLSPVAVAERMGHESIRVTYRYAHLFPARRDEIARKLNEQGGGR